MGSLVVPAVQLGLGIAGGISQYGRQRRTIHDIETQRNLGQDLYNQSTGDYYRNLAPTEYAYNQMAFKGGFTPEEQPGLYLTPEEAKAQYLTPEDAASIRVSPQEAAGIRAMSLAPIAGAATGARQRGIMAAAARGGYAPGLNATLEEVNRQQGRAAGETALGANLGISAANRAANQYIAQQRADTAARQGFFRTGQQGLIGQARMGQQQTGASGLLSLSDLTNRRGLYGLQQRGEAVRMELGQPSALASGIGAYQDIGGTALGDILKKK